jgi:hypothetical protein
VSGAAGGARARREPRRRARRGGGERWWRGRSWQLQALHRRGVVYRRLAGVWPVITSTLEVGFAPADRRLPVPPAGCSRNAGTAPGRRGPLAAPKPAAEGRWRERCCRFSRQSARLRRLQGDPSQRPHPRRCRSTSAARPVHARREPPRDRARAGLRSRARRDIGRAGFLPLQSPSAARLRRRGRTRRVRRQVGVLRGLIELEQEAAELRANARPRAVSPSLAPSRARRLGWCRRLVRHAG